MQRLLLIATIVFTCIVSSSPAGADAGSAAVSAALVDVVGSDLIKKFQDTSRALLDQANNTGNALLSRAANEANVTAQNISFLLKDQQNTAFKNLDGDVQKLIVQAEITRQKLSQLADKAYDMKDTTAVDLNYLVAAFPFVKERFFVQRISGLAYVDRPGDYSMRIIASTLGIEEGTSTSVTLSLGGKQVQRLIVDQSQQHGVAMITVPHDALAPMFNDTKLVIVSGELDFSVTRASGWWIFGSTKTDVYKVPVYFSLYPHVVATIEVEGKLPQFGWVDLQPKSASITTPDRHCPKHCNGEPTAGWNHIEMAVPGGPAPFQVGYQRFKSGAKYWCTGGDGCPFSDADAHPPTYTDNDTRIFADWRTWGKSASFVLQSTVQIYQQAGEAPFIQTAVPIRFDQIQPVDLPGNRTYAVLHVKTFTKQQYDMLVDGVDTHGLISGTLVNHSAGAGNQDRFAYKGILPALE